MDFQKDLKTGQKLEAWVRAKYESKKGWTVEPVDSKDKKKRKEYDLKIFKKNGHNFTIEVKHDLMAGKTKNACIELYDSSNNPSGLYGTKSDYMYFRFGKKFNDYLIETDEFKDYISDNESSFRIVKGGDFRAFTMILVPLKILTKLSFVEKVEW